MDLIVGQIDKLELSLVCKCVIGESHQLIVAQIQLKQFEQIFEHFWTDFSQVVVGDVEELYVACHLQGSRLNINNTIDGQVQPLEGGERVQQSPGDLAQFVE